MTRILICMTTRIVNTHTNIIRLETDTIGSWHFVTLTSYINYLIHIHVLYVKSLIILSNLKVGIFRHWQSLCLRFRSRYFQFDSDCHSHVLIFVNRTLLMFFESLVFFASDAILSTKSKTFSYLWNDYIPRNTRKRCKTTVKLSRTCIADEWTHEVTKEKHRPIRNQYFRFVYTPRVRTQKSFRPLQVL